MSTEGSDNSQIRQFNVYRSIDERTEDFLKLSRRRQLKQGCACAAISMTITITVVISIILIYEYTVVSDSNVKTTMNPSWLKLMNSSVSDLPFEVQLDKAKIGLDSATIKFLPLILKTLKKNKYFDKVEDTMNSSTTDKFETTKDVYKKNIFSDTRNWMKMPTSRFYTIEYKTSPIVYFKNPTRNIDYYKKVRKIRDYQRIMNYVDKMISERVTFGSTVPISKKYYRIPKKSDMYEYTTPMSKTKDLAMKTERVVSEKAKSVSPQIKPDCNCPKRMGDLLKKLISNLQSLVPNFNDGLSKNSSHGLCNHTQTTKPVTTKKVTKVHYSTTKIPMTKAASTIPSKITVAYKNIDYTFNNIIELLKPGLISRKKLNVYKETATEDYLKNNEANYIKHVTKPSKSNLNLSVASATTISDYILKRNFTSSMATIFTNKEYDDYIDTTPKVIYKNKKYDNQISELLKSDFIKNSSYQDFSNKKFEESTKNYEKQLINDSLTDTTEVVPSSTIPTIDNTFVNSLEFNKDTSSSTELSTNRQTDYTKDIVDFRSVSTNLPVTDKTPEQTLKSEDITLEEELNKTSLDDITPEESIKHLEDIIKTLNSTETNNASTMASELLEWELVNIEDYSNNYNIVNSMIPQNRASYLEIERSNWKPEEHQDYDNNVNNYFFE